MSALPPLPMTASGADAGGPAAAARARADGASRALRSGWRSLAARERRLVLIAGTLLAVALVWLVALQPAWRTLQRAPAERERAAATLQRMQQLAAEARALRDIPPVAPAQAQAALQAATERLAGRGRLSFQGDRAVLALTAAEPRQLREWLAEARSGARARPAEATLTRDAAGMLGGTLVMQIGGAP